MKKYVIIILFFLLMPIPVFALDGYPTLSFQEALKEENIPEAFQNYSVNDVQITIYLFRGKGCGYCKKFLNFMNQITDEYGKYFQIETFEVWSNPENSELLDEVSNFLKQPARGVPYIIIGNKVFSGYSSVYDEEIKSTIMKLYQTPKEDRYDVFTKMKKKNTLNSMISMSDLVTWNYWFVRVSTILLAVL